MPKYQAVIRYTEPHTGTIEFECPLEFESDTKAFLLSQLPPLDALEVSDPVLIGAGESTVN